MKPIKKTSLATRLQQALASSATPKRDRELLAHSKFKEASSLFKNRKLNRREFLRISTMIGVSIATASKISGVTTAQAFSDNNPFGPLDANAKQGGILKVAMNVQKLEDPATTSWTQSSNQYRHTLEYLVYTDSNNITHPMLAKSWQASDDLKKWTYNIRKGVKWHNGDELTADHVATCIKRWCDPKLGSSNVGLSTISAILEKKDNKKVLREGAIEVKDKYTLILHLSKPVLSGAEDFYDYPTAITHPSFNPPLSNNMIGTGGYQLSEISVGERCVLKRVLKMSNDEPFKYWGKGPYLDEIHYYNFSPENQLTSFISNLVDTIYSFPIEQLKLAETLNSNIIKTTTAQTFCVRMRQDQKPFNNKKLRQAIVAAVDNSAHKELVYFGSGEVGENHHVWQQHPEYYSLPAVKRNVSKAKQLLTEAGYPDGIELTVDCGNTEGNSEQAILEVIKYQLADAKIKLNINILPASKFWEIWNKTPFGITAWAHRPLGTMNLSLGYRSNVPWNETAYNNPAFDKALDEAESLVDVKKRRQAMKKVEILLQNDAVMIQSIWRPVYTIASDRVKNIKGHPAFYHQFNRVWID